MTSGDAYRPHVGKMHKNSQAESTRYVMPQTQESTSQTPRVSVIMTTYNGAHLIPRSIQAILDQTFTDFELLIVDDGSSDNTLEVVRSFDDPRIRLAPNEQNQGISISRNRALALARGEYVACNDQDDISHPDRLARQVEFLDNHPEVVMVSSALIMTNGVKSWPDPMPIIEEAQALHLALFFGHHNITYSTVCARVAQLRANQLEFRQEFHYAEDFEYYHRVAQIGTIHTLPDMLVTSLIHDANTSSVRGEQMADNGRRFLQGAYRELLDRTISDAEIALVWRLMVQKKPAQSLAELDQAGQLIGEVLQAFEHTYLTSSDDAQRVQRFAAKLWWQTCKAAAVGGLGWTALRSFDSQPKLASEQPTNKERAATYLKAAVPRKARKLIKRALNPGKQRLHK